MKNSKFKKVAVLVFCVLSACLLFVYHFPVIMFAFWDVPVIGPVFKQSSYLLPFSWYAGTIEEVFINNAIDEVSKSNCFDYCVLRVESAVPYYCDKMLNEKRANKVVFQFDLIKAIHHHLVYKNQNAHEIDQIEIALQKYIQFGLVSDVKTQMACYQYLNGFIDDYGIVVFLKGIKDNANGVKLNCLEHGTIKRGVDANKTWSMVVKAVGENTELLGAAIVLMKRSEDITLEQVNKIGAVVNDWTFDDKFNYLTIILQKINLQTKTKLPFDKGEGVISLMVALVKHIENNNSQTLQDVMSVASKLDDKIIVLDCMVKYKSYFLNRKTAELMVEYLKAEDQIVFDKALDLFNSLGDHSIAVLPQLAKEIEDYHYNHQMFLTIGGYISFPVRTRNDVLKFIIQLIRYRVVKDQDYLVEMLFEIDKDWLDHVLIKTKDWDKYFSSPNSNKNYVKTIKAHLKEENNPLQSTK